MGGCLGVNVRACIISKTLIVAFRYFDILEKIFSISDG